MLEFHEVLFMPGMKVNIFSLQRIKSNGTCSFSFHGVPRPDDVVQILNRLGEQIALMRETAKARPTLMCERFQSCSEVGGVDEAVVEGEILGSKGVQMDA